MSLGLGWGPAVVGRKLMVWLSQRYFWFWDVDDRSGLAKQGVPVNPQTGFTSYVSTEGGGQWLDLLQPVTWGWNS